MGFIGMFINQFAYILGVVFTTPDTASMFQPLVPVVVTIAAILLRTEPLPRLKTKIGSAKIFGILLATGGALIMAYGKQTGSKSSDDGKNLTKPKPYGYLFLVINISASALWVVMQKKFIFNKANSRWRDYPINITAWTYFFGAISMGLASLYYADKPEKFVIHKIEVVYCLIYAVFITSALCYMLITWCHMQVNSSFVTASWPLQVMFCAILSYIVLGEELVALQIVGGLMIIVALFAVTWSNYAEQVSNKQLNNVVTRHLDDDRPLLSDIRD